MPNKALSVYRGCSITTRWIEVVPRPDWRKVATRAVAQAKGFTASFSVAPPAESQWQEFPQPVFDTAVHAAENALRAAKRSIDLKFADTLH